MARRKKEPEYVIRKSEHREGQPSYNTYYRGGGSSYDWTNDYLGAFVYRNYESADWDLKANIEAWKVKFPKETIKVIDKPLLEPFD